MHEQDFVEKSIGDIIVPEASEVDLEVALGTSDANGEGEQRSLVPSIAQRQTLFFGKISGISVVQLIGLTHSRSVDETIDLYVVVRTLHVEEEALKHYLSRLAIRVEAHVLSLQPQSRQDGHATQTRDLIFSDTVKESEDPMTVVQESVDSSSEENTGHLFLFWKLKAFLSMVILLLASALSWLTEEQGHPRVRIPSPAIVFTVLATLRPATAGNGSTGQDQYLPSAVPAQFNLFESLQEDPSLGGAAPYLAASRLSRFTPATNAAKGSLRPLRQHVKRIFSAIHAASARLRYSRPKGYEVKPIVLASLEFEVAPTMRCDLSLQRVDLKLTRGIVEPLTTDSSFMVPLTCRPRDQIVLLYKLTPDEDPETNSANTPHTKALDISISAVALVSEDCEPHIMMRWRTSVDFSTPLNPSYGGPSQLLQRPHRPSSLPVPPVSGPASTVSMASSTTQPSLSGPESISSSGPDPSLFRGDPVNGLRVTMTISGPQYVHVGEAFHWDVFVVNRSAKIRILALLALPKSKTGSRRHISKSSSSSVGVREDDDAADAMVDENVLYAMQKNAAIEPAGLVNLSTDDLRIG